MSQPYETPAMALSEVLRILDAGIEIKPGSPIHEALSARSPWPEPPAMIDVERAVWRALDRVSCAGIHMQIAARTILAFDPGFGPTDKNAPYCMRCGAAKAENVLNSFEHVCNTCLFGSPAKSEFAPVELATIKAAPMLSAEDLADALFYFENAAVGSLHRSQAESGAFEVVSAIVQGVEAVACRLREQSETVKNG